MELALAVDLGGTKVEAALVDAQGTVVAGRGRVPTGRDTDERSLRIALERVVGDALAALPADARLIGVGIGAAGPVDSAHGGIYPVNMPGAHGVDLAGLVAEATRTGPHTHRLAPDLPVVLGHDGGCLALAEAWRGATRGTRASLSIVVSTGIGGGIVAGGRLLRGASGNAGHLGQTRSGDLTLEEVASGPASVAWARAQGWQGATGEDLARDAAAGDATARAAVVRSAEAVGAALADASTLLDLEVVAIGGGFSRVSADYVELVGESLRAHAVLDYARATRVVRSGLDDEGPLIGAAALVFTPLEG